MKKYKIKDMQLVVICDRRCNYSGNDLYTITEKNYSISFVKTKDFLNPDLGKVIDIFGRKLITIERMSDYPCLYQNFTKTIIKSEPLELVFNNKDKRLKISHDDLREIVVKDYNEILKKISNIEVIVC